MLPPLVMSVTARASRAVPTTRVRVSGMPEAELAATPRVRRRRRIVVGAVLVVLAGLYVALVVSYAVGESAKGVQPPVERPAGADGGFGHRGGWERAGLGSGRRERPGRPRSARRRLARRPSCCSASPSWWCSSCCR